MCLLSALPSILSFLANALTVYVLALVVIKGPDYLRQSNHEKLGKLYELVNEVVKVTSVAYLSQVASDAKWAAVGYFQDHEYAFVKDKELCVLMKEMMIQDGKYDKAKDVQACLKKKLGIVT